MNQKLLILFTTFEVMFKFILSIVFIGFIATLVTQSVSGVILLIIMTIGGFIFTFKPYLGVLKK